MLRDVYITQKNMKLITSMEPLGENTCRLVFDVLQHGEEVQRLALLELMV